VRPGTWNRRHRPAVAIAWALLLSIALGGLWACRPARPPSVPAPTAAPTPVPTARPTVGADFPTLDPTADTPCELERFAPATEEPTAVPQDEAPTATLPPALSPTAPVASPMPTAFPEITLVRGPYLQSVTTDSVIIVWETEQPGQGKVIYGETPDDGEEATDPAVGTRHAVTLTGLASYTRYHYRVAGGGEGATFRTAAGPDRTRFAFAVLGDTRTGHQFHRAVVEGIIARSPDFVLHTGDLVDRGTVKAEWETFFEIERELMARAPLFPALGNHEQADIAEHYFDYFHLPGNERWYAFDYGHARFVCLQVDGIAEFRPGSEQHAWLERALAANPRPWVFVYFHVPPYSSVQDDLEDDVRQALTPLFEHHHPSRGAIPMARYGVDVVFNGHKHSYERNEVNGVTYVVTAGGGAPLYAMQEREPTQAVTTWGTITSCWWRSMANISARRRFPARARCWMHSSALSTERTVAALT